MSISENIGVIHTKIRRRIANTIERVKNNHKKINKVFKYSKDQKNSVIFHVNSKR